MKNKLFILLLTTCLPLVLISCNHRHHDNAMPKKIEVTGSSEMEIVPNEIYITFTLKEYMDAAKKKVSIDSIRTEFLRLCKESGIADSNISISSYTGNEQWDYYWYRRRRNVPDYTNSVSLTILVSAPEKLDKVVEKLNENAIDNFYISKTSHSNIEQLREEVKKNALIAAKNKAGYLANSIGEKVGEALLIQEIDNSYSGYYGNAGLYSNSVSKAEVSEDNAIATPNFQKIKLRYEIKAEFKLK